MDLLEYENQIFLDCFHDDGLLVMARGLGIERVFLSFLKLYCDPEGLVLVLNTGGLEEEYFIEKLRDAGVKPLPRTVTSDYSINDRIKLYQEGGVLFITSRILVVDMLTERIPISVIAGILVYKAHKIIDSCQEAFILRLYRQKNKKGFVKAFSSHPQMFTSGFCHVERVMKSLFVRKLFLWPRFQASIVSLFNQHKVDVVELQIPVTPAMTACQTALLDLIDVCVKEIKRFNTALDTDEITVENALGFNFDKIVRHHLDPVWHQLSMKTRQLVADIKQLRLLLEYLTQYDCVNFFNLIHSMRTNEKTFGTNSGWLFHEAADSLYAHARERVYGRSDAKKQKTDSGKSTSAGPLLEECPKWQALKEVVAEIEEENARLSREIGSARVLIVARDDKTCNQIQEFLCEGGRSMMLRYFNKSMEMKRDQHGKSSSRHKMWKGKSREQMRSDELTLTQMVGDKTESDEEKPRNLDEVGIIKSQLTVVQSLTGSQDPFCLTKLLQEIQPRFVVMYDADIAFIRHLEVFRASRPSHPLRVYFMMYESSVEEQKYLTSMRKEKEAFEYLIREKATMVIPEEREGKMDEDPELSRDTSAANATTNTRRGGGDQKKTVEKHKIIVDMREFRSELPSLIHRRDIEIEPVTIDVGDYILTPEICVERKSLSDLIGSLNNGRLYNQCVSMCRFYRRPILLIEFDPNKPFSLSGRTPISTEMNSNDTQSKLTLLTLHFPRLRILWCPSPYATAELFQEIKMGRDQPSAKEAMAIGASEEELGYGKYNHGPQSLLLKMPGINSKNVHCIMNHVDNIKELVTLTQADLAKLLDSEMNAKKLYEFLHSEHTPSEAAIAGPSKGIAGPSRAVVPGKPGGQRQRKRFPMKGKPK